MADGSDASVEQDRPAGGRRPLAERLAPSTVQAIQVAVAVTIALAVGRLLSSGRWYWAVIAAVLLFGGAKSWEEVLTRGWKRLLGTAVSVPAGLLIAAAADGRLTLLAAVVLMMFFAQSYFTNANYTAAAFCLTVLLAAAYGMLGQVDLGLLLTRLGETAVGGAAGVAAALLVCRPGQRPWHVKPRNSSPNPWPTWSKPPLETWSATQT